MKNVQALLKKEAQAREILKNIGQEKEELAIKKLAETNEILKDLGCEHLLNGSVERPVTNISINKGKIVQITKEVKVPVEKIVELPGKVQVVKDMTEIEKHLSTIKALEKTISELENKLAQTIKPAVNNNAEEEAYMDYLATQEESIMTTQEEEIVVDAPATQTDIFVNKTKVNMGKNSQVKLYQTDRCYLIASPTTDEITWLSNVELSKEYKLQIEDMLVANHKFLPARTKLSPIKVDRENGYMARVNAVDGYENFSMKDVLSGYVKLGQKFFLYSYNGASSKVFIDSFDMKLANSAKTMPAKAIRDSVTAIVMDMYKEYKALVDAKKEEDNKKAQQAAKSFNDKQEKRRQQREADEALLRKAGMLPNTDKKPSVHSGGNLSASLEEIAKNLF